jgi:hypothetical protein
MVKSPWIGLGRKYTYTKPTIRPPADEIAEGCNKVIVNSRFDVQVRLLSSLEMDVLLNPESGQIPAGSAVIQHSERLVLCFLPVAQ